MVFFFEVQGALAGVDAVPEPLTLCCFSPQVPDDPADPVCAPASPQASALHLRVEGEVPPAPRSAHSGLPRARDQEAAGGAGHLPPGERGHGQLRLRPAV